MIANYDKEGRHSEAVPITFQNLPGRNFTYTRTDFNGKTNSLKVATSSATWQRLEQFLPNSAAILTLDFD